MGFHFTNQTITFEKKQLNKITVSIIEDEPLVLSSLEGLIGNQPGMEKTVSSRTVESFLSALHHQAPDIILLDIGLKGGMSGLEGIRPLKKKFPSVEIIMLTTFDDADRVFKALCGGASAYLTKRTPFPRIVEAIKTVHQGGSYMSPTIARRIVDHFAPTHNQFSLLTPRQNQITEAIVEGLSYKLIADKLLISKETVRDHIKKIYRKLQINSKAELIKMKMSGELD